MTVKDDGFFNYGPWITAVTVDTTDYPKPLRTYRFPMGDTYEGGTNDPNRQEADKDFGGVIVDGTHYYTKNPLNPNNWGPLGSGENTTYEAMNPKKWPGLSNKEAELWQDSQIINRYKLTDKDKQITRTYTKRSGAKIESLPSNVTDIYLDHNEPKDDENDLGNLKISFGQGTNSSNTPSYEYYNEDPKAAKGQTWVRKWEVPGYTMEPFDGVYQRFNAPERDVTYTEQEVEDKIDQEMNGIIGSIVDIDSERYILEGYNDIPITTKSIYSYASAQAARQAANTYFKDVINIDGQYQSISYSDISTPSQLVELCRYTYTYKKEKREWSWWPLGWGSWETVETGSGEGVLSKTLYTFVITCKTHDGEYFQYTSPGGWGDETTDGEKSMEPAKANVDALTFYAGNTFTITADPGYYIRSVKVNFNNSTIESGKTYLRLVDNSKNLPDTNKEPEQMTYLDGTNGWSKWTSVSNDISVTLRLVICDMNTNSWWIGNWGNPQMTHKDPSTSGQQNQSLIIESLEIRLEKVEETNN